ncbi:hypothetical protein J42TS3_23300 [Paenibacillus vini]|uniref:Uncharacterized protein n=1 Tax=Paenibacillus vini TaxID=1476024 RepID=A0ABQ4MBD4_9BACL|nr:hypothetical protein J42TS3_23300 [Paenibacillus vini]
MNNEAFSETFLKITLYRMCDLYFEKMKVTLNSSTLSPCRTYGVSFRSNHR